jgi:hypothetical protein
MSDVQTPSQLDAIAREWLAARIVFVVGFVIAIGFAAWWTWNHRPEVPVDVVVDASDPGAGSYGEIGTGQTSEVGFQLCRMATATAQNIGVFPANMRFAGGPTKGDRDGRYVCAADDPAGARFNITFDLFCRDLRNANCVNLYSLVKQDGTAVYQRHAFPGDPGVDAAAVENAAPAPEPDATAPAAPDATAPTEPAPDAGGGTPP